MSISQATIQELGNILKEDYQTELSEKEVSEIANELVGYFDLLAWNYQKEQSK